MQNNCFIHARGAGMALRSVLALVALVIVLVAPHEAGAAGANTRTGIGQHPGYDPAQLARAYDVTPVLQRGVTGHGQTIAFIEVDGADQNDFDYFNRTFGLPQTQLRIYVPAGSNEQLAPGPETSMDVEYAHALAPGATLQVYEVIKSGDFNHYSTHLADAVKGAIGNGATIISISLRGTGSILCSTFWAALHLNGTLKSAALDHGVAVFTASGDYGDHPCQGSHKVGTVYPASDPYVTAVGGTHLSTASSGAYAGETAWPGSGGGISTDFGRPDYQRGPGNFNSHYRNIPDVAFDADPHTGVLVRVQGQWTLEGGTSLGAPSWAAIWALASQRHQQQTGKRLGWANPFIYNLANSSRRASVFHDVTSGSNGSYQAGRGWDAVTGWGSPDVYNLVRALAS